MHQFDKMQMRQKKPKKCHKNLILMIDLLTYQLEVEVHIVHKNIVDIVYENSELNKRMAVADMFVVANSIGRTEMKVDNEEDLEILGLVDRNIDMADELKSMVVVHSVDLPKNLGWVVFLVDCIQWY